MLTKSCLWSCGWTLNFIKNRKITSPNPSQKGSWKSAAQHALTQPLETVKVVFGLQPQFSAFQLCCNMAGKVSPGSPHLGHFGHQSAKKHFPRLLQKPTKKTSRKTANSYQNGVLFGLHFWVFFYFLALCSDLGFPSPPKRSPDPKKVTKRHPTSDKIN